MQRRLVIQMPGGTEVREVMQHINRDMRTFVVTGEFTYQEIQPILMVEFLDPVGSWKAREGSRYAYIDLNGQEHSEGDLVLIPTSMVPDGARAIVREIRFAYDLRTIAPREKLITKLEVVPT